MSHEYGEHLSNQVTNVRGVVSRFALHSLRFPGKPIDLSKVPVESKAKPQETPGQSETKPELADGAAGAEEWISEFHSIGEDNAA